MSQQTATQEEKQRQLGELQRAINEQSEGLQAVLTATGLPCGSVQYVVPMMQASIFLFKRFHGLLEQSTSQTDQQLLFDFTERIFHAGRNLVRLTLETLCQNSITFGDIQRLSSLHGSFQQILFDAQAKLGLFNQHQ